MAVHLLFCVVPHTQQLHEWLPQWNVGNARLPQLVCPYCLGGQSKGEGEWSDDYSGRTTFQQINASLRIPCLGTQKTVRR